MGVQRDSPATAWFPLVAAAGAAAAGAVLYCQKDKEKKRCPNRERGHVD